MELIHQNNTAEAADPPAIVTAKPVPKAPVSNNDPTRDVSQAKRWIGALAIILSTVALMAMALAAVLLFRSL